LKGTLAAPVVLTVSSASAQSLTSFGRCLRRLSGQQPTDFFRGARDTWFRQQVPVVECIKGGKSLGYFYFDPKANSYVNVVSPYSRIGFSGRVPPNHSWRFGSWSTRWALVYFEPMSSEPYSDSMGRPIITLQKPSGYLASTISCYGSFSRHA
jgi:hypothetical protein